jgi:hypothetical protein
MEYQENDLYATELKLYLFGGGEWMQEPDYLEFQYFGYKCHIARNSVGALCGYVHLPKDHPWYGKDYDDLSVSVHGGLTFSREIEGAWVIGYDCSHAQDVSPTTERLLKDMRKTNERYRKFCEILSPTYKNMAFCQKECKSLAQQAHEAAAGEIYDETNQLLIRRRERRRIDTR